MQFQVDVGGGAWQGTRGQWAQKICVSISVSNAVFESDFPGFPRVLLPQSPMTFWDDSCFCNKGTYTALAILQV